MSLKDDHFRAIRETLGEYGRVNGLNPMYNDRRRVL